MTNNLTILSEIYCDEVLSEINELNANVEDINSDVYRITHSKILEFYYKIPMLRISNSLSVVSCFNKACSENCDFAVKFLFYMRDSKYGLNEKGIFRIILKAIFNDQTPLLIHEISKIFNILKEFPEKYGDYEDLIELIHTHAGDDIINDIIKPQLIKDLKALHSYKPYSNIANFMPSINSAYSNIRSDAKYLASKLNFSEYHYEKIISKLKNNTHAFKRDNHTNTNTNTNNNEKITLSQIVHLYKSKSTIVDMSELENLWNLNMPKFNTCHSLFIYDTISQISTSEKSLNTIDVITATIVATSNSLSGYFNNKFISCGSIQKIIDLSNNKTILDKFESVEQQCIPNLYTYSTHEDNPKSIARLFYLVLDAAIANNVSPNDMPDNLIILCDTEFAYLYNSIKFANLKLFNDILSRYKSYGYELPRLVCWIISPKATYTNDTNISIREDPRGVVMISGYSEDNFEAVVSGKINPLRNLFNKLMVERYQSISMQDVINK